MELKSSNAPVRIEILGINQAGLEGLNAHMTTGRSLSWLQDSLPGSVWESWEIDYRDVVILDPQGQVTAVYNLTSHDLQSAANREAIKQLFLAAAQFVDTDGDQLSDYWEQTHFRGLLATPEGDDDLDGQDNFTEYAFGTNPKDATSRSVFVPEIVYAEGGPFLGVLFHRRGGWQIEYLVETSNDLMIWSGEPASFHVMETFQNLFDRTGTGRSRCRLTTPIQDGARGFIRVRAQPAP